MRRLLITILLAQRGYCRAHGVSRREALVEWMTFAWYGVALAVMGTLLAAAVQS